MPAHSDALALAASIQDSIDDAANCAKILRTMATSAVVIEPGCLGFLADKLELSAQAAEGDIASLSAVIAAGGGA
jgi:hypothetical protein